MTKKLTEQKINVLKIGSHTTELSGKEFVVMMAMMMSLMALAIDTMIPALGVIGQDLGVQNPNHNQMIISLFFLGMAIGQMIYGPISDHLGRKPAIYIGIALFMIGSIFSILATSFYIMLVGRVLQGLGVAAARVIVVALIRDKYKGSSMARIMSLVFAILMFVPIVAPGLGQGIILITSWRVIFIFFLALGFIIFLWFSIRQPETLSPENRIQFSFKQIGKAIWEICRNRISFGYTMAAGMIWGAFLGYLNSTQQIFQDQYQLGAQLPIYFALQASAIACAFFVNARMVTVYGMETLAIWAIQSLSSVSIIFFAIAYFETGNPPLWSLMVYYVTAFFCVGILFGNINALAMEPLGHIAGVGASVIGSLTTFISIPLGIFIGQGFNNTVLPLVGGFSVLSSVAMVIMLWTKNQKSKDNCS